MTKLKALIILIVFIKAAIAQEQSDAYNPAVTRHVYQPGLQIVIKKYDEGFEHSLEKGNKIVFNYYHRAKDYAHVTDDEFTEYFRFEIDKLTRKFTLKNEELIAASFIYNRGCFCPETGNYLIRKGTVTARRIGLRSYKLHIKIWIEPRDTSGMILTTEKEVKAVFKKGKINID